MKNKILASIFIPTSNRGESLKKTLSSLTKQTYNNFETIIVDYKSTDNTQKIVNLYKNILSIRFIEQKEKGLVKAANLALKKAKGEIFIRTDDDVIMKKYWLESIISTFKSNPKIGGVTGPTIILKKYLKNRDLFLFEKKMRHGSLFWKIIGMIYFNYFMEKQFFRVCHWFDCGAFSLGSNYKNSLKQPQQEINNLEACNWSVRTKLLKKISGFNNIYTGVAEYHEADAAFKIKRLGYKLIFNPKVYLNHCPSQDGFFKERPSSFSRMENFLIFTLLHIKPNTISKVLRYFFYLIFINCYYIYQAIKCRQISQLGALVGNFTGYFKYKTLKHYR